MIYVLLTLLIILLAASQSYSIILLLRSERKISIYENWIIEFRERVKLTHKTMKEVDIRGSFEADDEVGNVFKAIQQMVNDLNNIVSDENESENNMEDNQPRF